MEYRAITQDEYISHYGVMGMRWGHRKDGGPQGYLGTYPTGTGVKRGSNKKVKDSAYRAYLAKSVDDFNDKVYSYYAEKGITKDMVDVNKVNDTFSKKYDRMHNCTLASVSAMLAYEGHKCTANGSVEGNNVGGALHGLGLSEKDITFTHLKSHIFVNGYNSVVKQIKEQVEPGTHGVISATTQSGGHAMYYRHDKNGEVVIFDPQNPNRNIKYVLDAYGKNYAKFDVASVKIGAVSSKKALENAKKNGIVLKSNDTFQNFKEKDIREYSKHKQMLKEAVKASIDASNKSDMKTALSKANEANTARRKEAAARINVKKFKKANYDIRDMSIYEKNADKIIKAGMASMAVSIGASALAVALPAVGVPVAAISFLASWGATIGGIGATVNANTGFVKRKLKNDEAAQKNIDKILEMVKELEKEKQ